MPDTPEQRSVELWECPLHGRILSPIRHQGVCGKRLTGPHRYVPESESISKAELVETGEALAVHLIYEKCGTCGLPNPDRQTDCVTCSKAHGLLDDFRAVLDHINESESK